MARHGTNTARAGTKTRSETEEATTEPAYKIRSGEGLNLLIGHGLHVSTHTIQHVVPTYAQSSHNDGKKMFISRERHLISNMRASAAQQQLLTRQENPKCFRVTLRYAR